MIRVSGYTPEESAQGLFIIYLCMLISFLVWGYFVPKFSKNVNDAIRLLKSWCSTKFIFTYYNNLFRSKSRIYTLGSFYS
jgi:hypothetical protein